MIINYIFHLITLSWRVFRHILLHQVAAFDLAVDISDPLRCGTLGTVVRSGFGKCPSCLLQPLLVEQGHAQHDVGLVIPLEPTQFKSLLKGCRGFGPLFQVDVSLSKTHIKCAVVG